jgi:hypothetical protein
MLVLRLLAVYFATCALSVFLANRFVSRIRPAVGLFLALLPFLLTGEAMLTAGVSAPLDIAYQGQPLASHREEQGIARTRTPILGDVVFQEIPWRKAVREAVKNGRLPLWNRFQLAGEPLLAVQQPAVLHPATWIGFLVPLAQAWTFEMSLRYFLALLSMYLLLRDVGCGQLPSLLGAVGWGLCEYLVFFSGYPLSPAAAPFPLLVLGLRRLVREPAAGRGGVALTVVALLLVVTSGHPETLLHAFAGAGLFFLFELAFAGPGRRSRPLLRSLLAGGVTLGLSAVLLIPLAEALPHTAEHAMRNAFYAHVDKSASVAESLRRSIPNVVPWGLGISGEGNTAIGFGEPAAYVGAVLLPFALLGLLSRRREKWPLLAVAFLGLAMWAKLPLVGDLVSSLPLFDIGLNERMVFLGAFGIAGLAALGAEHFAAEQRFLRLFAATLLAAASVLFLCGVVRPTLLRLGMPPDFLRERLLLEIVPLLLLAAGLAAAFPGRRSAAVLTLALLLLLVERRFEAARIYPTFPARAFYPSLPVLDPVPRQAPWRFAAWGFLLIPNAGTMYELEDVRGYEAMTFQPLAETFPLWCVPQPVWFNRVDHPTSPFLAFLNVRWVLAPAGVEVPPGWKVLSEGDETRLLENPAALERLFVPRLVRRVESAAAQRDAILSISDFRKWGIVAGPESGDWSTNGRASVRIESYRPQQLVASVDAERAAVVGTSIPAWPGWKLEIDGRRARLLAYNRAFLGFTAPRGRHRVVLRYRPDSFSAGLAVTGATLAACVLTAFVRRRRTTPARASP